MKKIFVTLGLLSICFLARASVSGSWSSGSSNITGGSAGQIPQQSGVSSTVFITTGTEGNVLTAHGTSLATWETPIASSSAYANHAGIADLATYATQAGGAASVSASAVAPGNLGAGVYILGSNITGSVPHADTATYANTAGALSGTGPSIIASTQTSIAINVDGATTTITASGTKNNVFTGISFDANGSNNELKWKDFQEWNNADYIVTTTNTWYTTLSTDVYYGQAMFSNSVSSATNGVRLRMFAPPDFSTNTDPVLYFGDIETGVDPSSRTYQADISSVTTGVSQYGALTFSLPITFTVVGVSPGAKGVSGQVGPVTLTGWGAFMAPSTHYVVRISRQGDAATDVSTVDSAFGKAILWYGRDQHQ